MQIFFILVMLFEDFQEHSVKLMEFACFQRDIIISVGWEAGGGGGIEGQVFQGN